MEFKGVTDEPIFKKIFSKEYAEEIKFRFNSNGETETYFEKERIYIEFCEHTNLVRLPAFVFEDGQYERVFTNNLFKIIESYQKKP